MPESTPDLPGQLPETAKILPGADWQKIYDELTALGHSPTLQPASRGRCLGIAFNAAGAAWRRCQWAGEITAPTVDGERCPACERLVKDRQFGDIASELISPVPGAYVYLADDKGVPGVWVLVSLLTEVEEL